MILISDHHEHVGLFFGGAASYYVISAFISTMPPYNGKSYWGRWAYGFLQVIGANLKNILPAFQPPANETKQGVP